MIRFHLDHLASPRKNTNLFVADFGLRLKDASRDALVLAALAGVEWQVSDHWSVAVTPRLEVQVGGVDRFALLLAVSVAYGRHVL